MSDFRDPELEQLLRNADGATLDVASAYAHVQRRVRTVRRRRVAVVTSAACVALFAVAAFALAHPSDSDGKQAASDTSTPADGSRLAPITTNSAVPTTATPSTLAPTTVAPTTALETTSTDVTSEPPVTATTISVSSSPPSPPPTRTTVPRASVPATTVVTPSEQTFVGVGGRITVRLQDATLVLVSYQPAAGFTAKVEHESGSRVEVHFESASHETTARVEVDGGQMTKRFEESDS
jgi:hypothetical protein